MNMVKKFLAETRNVEGVNYLNAYGTPTTVRFDLSRELEITDRIRALDEAAVANMMCSLGREGQLKPILIRVWPAKNHTHTRLPRLISGAHRIEAARRLKWTHLSAWLVECDDDEARQAEIDENLVRKELSPRERGVLYTEWLALHGKTASDDGDGLSIASDAALPDSEATTVPSPARPDEPGASVVSSEAAEGVVDTNVEELSVVLAVPDAAEAHSAANDDAGSVDPVIAENLVHVDQVSPAADPGASRPVMTGGRGKRSGISELSRATGRSRNAIKRDIAAAEGKPPKPPKPKPGLASGLERRCRDDGVPDARIEELGKLPLSEQGPAVNAACEEAILANHRAKAVERERAADKGPSEVMKATAAAVAMILKDIRDRSALLTHLEQIDKGFNKGLLLQALLSGLREPARAA
jgi:hypothetical protein